MTVAARSREIDRLVARCRAGLDLTTLRGEVLAGLRTLMPIDAEASTQFRALGEGVAWTELRGNPLPPDPERFWRNAFHALISGFAAAPGTH